MITAQYHKRMPKSLINRCSQVVKSHTCPGLRTSNEEINWFSFENEDGETVGLVNLQWDGFEYRDGYPAWNVYIALFEVCDEYKGMGYGREMVQWLESLPVHRLTLNHCSPEDDGGASYRFWRHMGWHKPSRLYSEMIKNIK